MKTDYIIRDLTDIEEIEKIPLENRITEKNTYELLDKAAAINPQAIALSFLRDGVAYDQPAQVTYSDFIKRIRQTANMLHDLGVGPEDVVTYLLPNLPETHYVLWGSEAVGISNPVNPLLDASAIQEICIAAGTKVIIALADLPGTVTWSKVEAIRDEIPSLTHIIRVMGSSDAENGVLGYEDIIDHYDGDGLSFDREFNGDDISSLYHTGGTTGRPKLACRTHNNEITTAYCLNFGMDIQPSDTILVGLPLFHANATIITGLVPFARGGHVVLLSPSGYRNQDIMRNFYKIVDHYRPIFFSCVPTILSVLLEIPIGDADISSLKFVACGAAPLSVELFNKFEDYCGVNIVEGYGLTESTVACSWNPRHGQRKIGSIGLRVPYQSMKIVVLNEDGNYERDANTNEIGVVCIKGPCIFKGYLEDRHNKGIWVQDGWFNSGDLGRQDEDGYFWLAGRRKELIIRGGHNIDPATIEDALYKMDQVVSVAAVGKPDAHAGEVPIAYVELMKDASITEKDVMSWARENISERAAIPKEINIIDQIPLTAVGKIFKPALRWEAIKRAYAEQLETLQGWTTIEDITVGEHKLYGTNVVITLNIAGNTKRGDIESLVSKVLAPYSVHYDLVIK